MELVTISPAFEVVIPLSVRERLDLRPGQQVGVIAYENHMEFIPLRPPGEMRGFLKGMSTEFERDALGAKTDAHLGRRNAEAPRCHPDGQTVSKLPGPL